MRVYKRERETDTTKAEERKWNTERARVRNARNCRAHRTSEESPLSPINCVHSEQIELPCSSAVASPANKPKLRRKRERLPGLEHTAKIILLLVSNVYVQHIHKYTCIVRTRYPLQERMCFLLHTMHIYLYVRRYLFRIVDQPFIYEIYNARSICTIYIVFVYPRLVNSWTCYILPSLRDTIAILLWLLTAISEKTFVIVIYTRNCVLHLVLVRQTKRAWMYSVISGIYNQKLYINATRLAHSKIHDVAYISPYSNPIKFNFIPSHLVNRIISNRTYGRIITSSSASYYKSALHVNRTRVCIYKSDRCDTDWAVATYGSTPCIYIYMYLCGDTRLYKD